MPEPRNCADCGKTIHYGIVCEQCHVKKLSKAQEHFRRVSLSPKSDILDQYLNQLATARVAIWSPGMVGKTMVLKKDFPHDFQEANV